MNQCFDILGNFQVRKINDEYHSIENVNNSFSNEITFM